MNFSADRLIENLSLKKSLLFWKTLTVVILVGALLLFLYFNKVGEIISKPQYIGRISINGFIGENLDRDKKILDLKNDQNLKGLIIHVNSPGGTITGGESLYNVLSALAKEKPTVILMDGLAASGGYMISLAGDYIIAHHGTITGSIGVLLQTPDLSEISKKLGIGLNVIRSGDLKAIPSMFEKLTEDGKKSLQDSLSVAYDYFLSLVLDKRKITDPKIIKLITTGKIFIGKQALESQLIDEIGNEDSAVKWLESKNITGKIKDIRINPSKLNFPSNVGKSNWKKELINNYLENQGILAILPTYLGNQYLISSHLNE
jgi:protease-4